MNKKTYSERLRDPRWQKMRLQVLERDSFTCILCSDTETELHIHHGKYSGEPWKADPNELFTICKHCHTEVEAMKPSLHLRDITIFKVTGGDGVNDRMMLVVLENLTIMRVYNSRDELLNSIDLGLREMSMMDTAFGLANQRVLRFRNSPCHSFPF